jgi:Cytochrome c biogenesis factor
MNVLLSVGLVVFVVLAGILFVRYVNAVVDREFRNLARAESDGAFRTEELGRVNSLLENVLPFPDALEPMKRPSGFGRGMIAPALFVLGVLLLWGGVSAGAERMTWLYGGLACSAAASVGMLITIPRRKWERVARLLRFRADLQRLDDNAGAAALDLRQLLKLTPWDDAAWSELADDLANSGDRAGALEAIRQAVRLDPAYADYRMQAAELGMEPNEADMETNNG